VFQYKKKTKTASALIASLHFTNVLDKSNNRIMHIRYRNSADNTVENSSVFFLIRMYCLPSARACGQ